MIIGGGGQTSGGTGGGLIFVTAWNTLYLTGSISASGSPGRPQAQLTSSDRLMGDTEVGGGGAGGTISIRCFALDTYTCYGCDKNTLAIKGNVRDDPTGLLDVSGGYGGAGGGGGGSGGFLTIIWLNDTQNLVGENPMMLTTGGVGGQWTNPNSNSYFNTPTKNITGGEDGGDALQYSSPECGPGYFGLLCSPCDPGIIYHLIFVEISIVI